MGDVSEHTRSTPLAATLQRLSRLAARLLHASSAVVWLPPEGSVPGPRTEPGVEPDLLSLVAERAVRNRAPVVVGDVRDEPWWTAAPVTHEHVRAVLAVPIAGATGPVGALCVADLRPRLWSPEDVHALEEMGVSVASELAMGLLWRDLEASRARSDLVMDAAGIGSFDWDLRSGRLVWDERMMELFDYANGGFGEVIGDFTARVHPDDVERVSADIRRAVEHRADFSSRYRVVHRDGRVLSLEARGRVLLDETGEPVRFLGAAYDSTADLEGEARVGRVLDSMSTGFFMVDDSWRFAYVNAEAERVLGASREELLGRELWDMFSDAVGSRFEAQYRSAVASGRPVDFEAYYPPPLDRWYEVRAWPGPDGLSVYFHDVTARRLAQTDLERAAARSTLLAQVVAELAGTLDVREAVERLTRLVVPALADWCVVALFDDAGTGPTRPVLLDVASWHDDPAMRPVVSRYVAARRDELADRELVSRVARSEGPMVLAGDAARVIAEQLEPGEAQGLLSELDPADCVALPLRAHGRAVGLLTLYGDVVHRGAATPSGAASHAVELAHEVAARAALALDNARLYAQQRRVAEELQRSLLSPPPTVEHIEIEVRYQPAAEAARVGGDWYDVFSPRPDVTTVVIGDVAGHDIAAAATMGQVRAMLRGISAGSPKGPAAVLTRLDEVLDILAVEVAATAAIAQLEHTEEDCERGQVRLTWSSAGHPTPIVVRPDGTVVELGDESFGADLLLGVDSTYTRQEHRVTLPVGSTLLLFTDGLVERRREHYRVGLQRLQDALAGLSGLPLGQLCDAVLAQVLPERPGDDVALAAVRIY